MQLIIDLPDRDQTLAFHRQRWAEVLCDTELARIPGRIETNAYGQIIMTPPASDPHSTRQGNLVFELRQRLGGVAKPECPVATSDGVKAIDVGWYSTQRHESVRGQLVNETAPEICVEVLSPSNTTAEIKNKFRLYFEAGAIECWQCDLEGRVSYFQEGDVETSHEQSSLCPDFPSVIRD